MVCGYFFFWPTFWEIWPATPALADLAVFCLPILKGVVPLRPCPGWFFPASWLKLACLPPYPYVDGSAESNPGPWLLYLDFWWLWVSWSIDYFANPWFCFKTWAADEAAAPLLLCLLVCRYWGCCMVFSLSLLPLSLLLPLVTGS